MWLSQLVVKAVDVDCSGDLDLSEFTKLCLMFDGSWAPNLIKQSFKVQT